MTMPKTNNVSTVAPKPQSQSASDVWTLVALAMGFVMATLDVTIVNVAVADIQDKLALSLSETTWVVDGYILSFAALLLAGGSLANRYGAKTIYMIGLVIFVLASLLCAQAPSGDMLVIARIIQGVGAALFMPSSLSLLAFAYSDEKKRAKMFGIWSAIVSIASGLGPFVGGVLVNTFGWKSIFWINLPIGVIGLLLAYFIVKQSTRTQSKLNFLSHVLGIITLSSTAFALIEGSSYGWTSNEIIGAVSLALISAIFFLIRENKIENPIIPSGLFKNSQFSAANMIGFLINFSLFGGIFMFGLFLQTAKGASPFMAGLELLPLMIVFVVGNLLFARLTTRFGTKMPMLVSLSVAGIGSLLLVTVSPSMPYWLIASIFAIVNLGIGVSVPAMTATVMQVAGRANANIAGATLNANRQIGALVGIAVMGVVLKESADWYSGASNTFLSMSISYFVAAFLVWRFVRSGTNS